MALTPVQVFETDAGDFVMAFLGAMGSDGLLIWRGALGWEFHEPNSLAWDSQHQGVYRNSRATPIDQATLGARGIPWPDALAYPKTSRQWKDNFVSALPMSPALDAALGALAGGATLPVHLILFEDRYETSFGDGKFLYPYAAFWDAEQCDDCLRRLNEEEQLKIAAGFYSLGHAFSAKALAIRLDAATQTIHADLRIETYEHYDLNEVLLLLDPRMAWKAESRSVHWRAAVEPQVLERLDAMRHGTDDEQVWIVLRRHYARSPFGTIAQPVVEAAFWSEAQAHAYAQQRPPGSSVGSVRICAHHDAERLVGYQVVGELALHNVVALLALS
jgi:hypothetical protein